MKFPTSFHSLLFLLFFTVGVVAQEVRFDDSGYAAVLKRSKTEHKPVFFLLYANWCPHCTKMKSEVFKDPAVAEFMNANFICAWQDLDKPEGDFFKTKFRIRAYPTFMFFDEKGTVLYHFSGEFKSVPFLAEAKNALVPEKQLPYLEKEFYADPSNSTKCLAYLSALKKGNERTVLNPLAQRYFETQTDDQLISENNWRIIANGVSDIESRPFQYVLKNQEAFARVASPKRVQRKIANIVTEMLQPFAEMQDTVNYYKKRTIAQSLRIQQTDSIIFRYDLVVSEHADNWLGYHKAVAAGAEKYVWSDAKLLREIAENYLKFINDSDSLNTAERLSQRSLELNATYDGEMLLAKLYQKMNDTKSALAFAQKAKSRNGGLGFNTKEADELLIQLGSK